MSDIPRKLTEYELKLIAERDNAEQAALDMHKRWRFAQAELDCLRAKLRDLSNATRAELLSVNSTADTVKAPRGARAGT